MNPSSLRARLRGLVLVALIAVLLPLALYSFHRTVAEIDELSDGRLAQAARTLDILVEHSGVDFLRAPNQPGLVVPTAPPIAYVPQTVSYTYESEVGFQIFDNTGKLLLATANLAGLSPPRPGEPDFDDRVDGGYRWRIFTLFDRADGVVYRTGERYDSRHNIMTTLYLDHGLPLLIGLPLLALLIGRAVRRGLRPLEALTAALSQREPGSREPVLLNQAPLELRPVLDALNGQFARIEDALERERRFSADVAHELRTPLASTMINLDNALATTDPPSARASFLGAQQNLAALVRRVEQLLALARLESGAAANQRRAVELVALASNVIEELAPLIADSGVELSFVRAQPQVWVNGYEAALAALLRNLIENALRHVPTGGKVQLVVGARDLLATIEVIDDGPGIPAARREAVFARFHREPGSRSEGYGLGLSIVQRAAQLHEARIELLDAPGGRGLHVRLILPLSA